VQKNADSVTPQQEAFIHEYDANGGNGTQAYLASHQRCLSIGAAGVEAHRYLKQPKIYRRIQELRAARWRRLRMDGDEAMGRLARDARADIRELFDEKDEVLPVHLWPESVAQSVRWVKRGRFGTAIMMNDSFAARRYIAEAIGKTKNPVTAAAGELARLLTRDFTEDE
jgi:hypothetical protein